MPLEFINLTLNAGGTLRKAFLEGREHYVVPMVMMTEGVHNGSGGPLLYRASELEKAVPAWNHKPIMAYHPTLAGQGVSACSPEVLNRQKIGVVLNTGWNGKQRAEAWIDCARVATVDPRIESAIHRREKVEVSTGLFVDRIPAQPGATCNAKPYAFEAVNHRPDHLAVLPDQVGACSIADGAGLFQWNAKGTAMNESPMPEPIYNQHAGRLELAIREASAMPVANYQGSHPAPVDKGHRETPMPEPSYDWKR